jgi:hypothetical protein
MEIDKPDRSVSVFVNRENKKILTPNAINSVDYWLDFLKFMFQRSDILDRWYLNTSVMNLLISHQTFSHRESNVISDISHHMS